MSFDGTIGVAIGDCDSMLGPICLPAVGTILLEDNFMPTIEYIVGIPCSGVLETGFLKTRTMAFLNPSPTVGRKIVEVE